eukprot:8125692-Pyramimonas_sp.AAC.1
MVAATHRALDAGGSCVIAFLDRLQFLLQPSITFVSAWFVMYRDHHGCTSLGVPPASWRSRPRV